MCRNSIDLEIRGSTPFFSSSKFMVTGNVAVEEAVPKAVVKAFVIFAMNVNGSFRVQTLYTIGSTTNP